MKFGVLGPLVVDDGEVRPVPGPPKQRLVLAVLVRRAGEMVSTAELVDALWGEAVPRSAGENLRSYVYGLRRALGRDVVTGNGRSGYGLGGRPEDIDVTEFLESAHGGSAALAAGDLDRARGLLRGALALWRGYPYGDVDQVPVLAAEAERLDELRLLTTQRRIEADLRAGVAEELLFELGDLVRRHPYREGFYRQMMLALYRSARQADALAVYREARAVLGRELGIEPNEELRALERAILRRDPTLDRPGGRTAGPGAPASGTPVSSAASPPAQLPATVSAFACRESELKSLDALTAADAIAGGTGPAVITGTAGVGKTALAVHWAHGAAGRFPDGQLFIDLRGFHPASPVSPHDALVRFLRALGVDQGRIPPTLDETAALYRSLLSGRRILVVLDNAASAGQVRPLLPGSAGCVAVITSRNRLAGLAVRDAAGQLQLDPMSTADAVELLRQAVGAGRFDAEPGAVADLAAACGHLPLALRIVAAQLAEHPGRSIAEHAGRLRDGNRLSALQIENDDQAAVEAALDLSYLALSVAERRMFRLLGLVPGADFAADGAAALAGCPVEEASRCLGRLADANLIHPRPADRYSLHDLIREYAADRAGADPADGEASLERLFDHYVKVSGDAAQVLYPQMLRLPATLPATLPDGRPDGPRAASPDGPPVASPVDRAGEQDGPGEPDRPRALAWMAAELPNLAAACVHAARHGPHRIAWVIADAIRGYCYNSKKTADWAIAANAAARAADLAGDLAARAATELGLGLWHACGHDLAEAVKRFSAALELSRRAGWREAEAAVLANTATVYGLLGDLERSREHQRAALAVNAELGRDAPRAVGLSNLGLTSVWLGRLAEAERLYLEAVALFGPDDSRGSLAQVLINLIEVYVLMNRMTEAHDLVAEARRTSREVGRVDSEAHVLMLLSAICLETGDPAAMRHANRAVELVDHTRDPLLRGLAYRAVAAVHQHADRRQEAVTYCRIAHQLAVQTLGRFFEAQAAISLATARHRAGEAGVGAELRQTLAGVRANGYRILEGRAFAALAEIALDAGDAAAAAAHAAQALAIRDETGWRPGRQTAARLRAAAGP